MQCYVRRMYERESLLLAAGFTTWVCLPRGSGILISTCLTRNVSDNNSLQYNKQSRVFVRAPN